MVKKVLVMLALLMAAYQPCSALPTSPLRTGLPLPESLAPPPECKVISGEFGTIDESGTFSQAAEVPFIPGQEYGWRIKVEPADGMVHWKEEFQLPGVPKTWGGNEPGEKLAPSSKEHQELKSGGKVCVSEKDAWADEGFIFNFWTVAKGDPTGQYEMRVYVEGKLAKTFVFQLVGKEQN